MNGNHTILNELADIAPTLSKGKVHTPYALPDEYFEIFPEMLLDAVHAKPLQHTLPPDYFENFAGNMMAAVHRQEVQDELEPIAPLLNSISKQMPFHLPAGYFEQPVTIGNRTMETRPARVVRIPSADRKTRPIWSWVAAASLIITLGIASFVWQYRKVDDIAVNREEPIETILTNLDDGRLNSYLNEQQETDAYEFARTLFYANENIENGLKGLSTDALATYLETYPEIEPGT